jgi:hypothetical protein
VKVVDEDGEWCGIAPPSEASAWVHKQHVRKVGEAVAKPPEPKEKPEGKLDATAAAEALRKVQELYQAELAKPAETRSFDVVLAEYQRVAAECKDPAVAARAEQARQRLLKIVDLHSSLQAARQPLDEFEKKYKALEEEYRKRVNGTGKPKEQ